MKFFIAVFASILFLVSTIPSSVAFSRSELIDSVHLMQDTETPQSCSAVMIAPERALTAAHCLGMVSPVLRIEGVDYRITEGYSNPEVDLAVLIVPLAPCPCAKGAKNRVVDGELVYAVGYPYGMGPVVTVGEFQTRVIVEGREYLMSTVRVAPGNSGGALFNKNKELVGITVAADAGLHISLSVEVQTNYFADKRNYNQ